MGLKAYLGDLNLNRGVVLGPNEPVGGGALPGDVELHNPLFIVLHLCSSKKKLLALK